MQNNRVWERACELTATVVEGVRFDEVADAIVVSARPDARARGRCERCGRRSPGYDRGPGRRRWRDEARRRLADSGVMVAFTAS